MEGGVWAMVYSLSITLAYPIFPIWWCFIYLSQIQSLTPEMMVLLSPSVSDMILRSQDIGPTSIMICLILMSFYLLLLSIFYMLSINDSQKYCELSVQSKQSVNKQFSYFNLLPCTISCQYVYILIQGKLCYYGALSLEYDLYFQLNSSYSVP